MLQMGAAESSWLKRLLVGKETLDSLKVLWQPQLEGFGSKPEVRFAQQSRPFGWLDPQPAAFRCAKLQWRMMAVVV